MKLKYYNQIATLIVFLSILAKVIIFEVAVSGGENYAFITSFKDLFHLIIGFFPKLSVTVFVASFCCLFKRNVWFYIINSIIDSWIIVNLLYYQVNNLFIDVDVIRMSGNLTDLGVAQSVFPYLSHTLPYLAITVVSYIILYFISIYNRERNPRHFLFSLLVSFVCALIPTLDTYRSNYLIQKEERVIQSEEFLFKCGPLGQRLFLPFNDVRVYSAGNSFNEEAHWQKHYITDHSILHYLPAIFVYDSFKSVSEDIVINAKDVEPFVNKPNGLYFTPPNNLIIILVESLESWPISTKGQLSSIAPNLEHFSHNPHVLYCDRVKAQVRNGVSGDGQLIVNTGLLPLQRGAACQLYGTNVYPNFAHVYQNSSIINPWPHIWNQDVVTYSYGYKQLLQPEKGRWNDEMIVDKLISELDKHSDAPQCIMTLTYSMHMPFHWEERLPYIKKYDDTVSDMLANYLACLSYTDKCLGHLIDKIQSDEHLSNSIIIITGDHNVFKTAMNDALASVTDIDATLVANGTYCPLFIYSPQIGHNTIINEEVLQMDLYPTILDLIGYTNYYWKGFGKSIIKIEDQRLTTEIDAYKLSEKLIRTDYFKQYNND